MDAGHGLTSHYLTSDCTVPSIRQIATHVSETIKRVLNLYDVLQYPVRCQAACPREVAGDPETLLNSKHRNLISTRGLRG